MAIRKTIFTLLTLILVWPASADSWLAGRVVGVSDGDTITLLDGNKQYRVRLAEIDAPERKQDFGSRAKQALSDLVYERSVQVRVVDNDRYGRSVGVVYVQSENVNLALVQQGMAWAYLDYVRDPEILAAEREARSARVGLWAAPNPTPPWQYRKERQQLKYP